VTTLGQPGGHVCFFCFSAAGFNYRQGPRRHVCAGPEVKDVRVSRTSILAPCLLQMSPLGMSTTSNTFLCVCVSRTLRTIFFFGCYC
jgi:hypothetical protein